MSLREYKAYRVGRLFDVGVTIRTPRGDIIEMFGGSYRTYAEAKRVAERFNQEVGGVTA